MMQTSRTPMGILPILLLLSPVGELGRKSFEPSQMYAWHKNDEERQRAIEQSTWICDHCQARRGNDQSHCKDCGRHQGWQRKKTAREAHG